MNLSLNFKLGAKSKPRKYEQRKRALLEKSVHSVTIFHQNQNPTTALDARAKNIDQMKNSRNVKLP